MTLHIGIHRTGTTALQRNLAANRIQLNALGKAYPFEGENHQSIAWGIHRGDVTGASLGKSLQPYSRFEHIIMSGEDFCIHKSLDWLAPLTDAFDVDAIVYLRRQDHWLMSWYNQHVKWPFSRRHSIMTPGEFLDCLGEFYWLDFEKTLEMWEAALGQGRLHVRVVEKGQVENTIDDFLAFVGVEGAALNLENMSQNDSLPVEALEFVRGAKMIDIKPPQRIRIVKFFQEVVRPFGQTGKTLYTAEQRQSVLDTFEASNRAVAKRWFGREALFLEGPPDEKGLYVEGTLAANAGFEDLMNRTVAFLGKDKN